ncbi:MAG: DUF58 domain-containing protein [Gemmatimonadaceae bacterium]|nr:DUF58 domain-containing protein [Gemmatimonadaceae bacterium]
MESTKAPRADLLDPAAIAALGRLEVVARWVVDGFMAGLHRSPRKGFSVEFAEYRPYQPGDDPRYIDWKIAARADRWVVRQYEEETNLRATIVLDVSRSMAWKGSASRLTKLEYSDRLAAALTLLLLRQRDAVGIVRFDSRVRSAVPPRASRGQWRRVIGALEEPGAGLASAAGEGLRQAARLVRRRGLVLLITDLLLDREEIEDPLRALRAAGHDVTVLHVLDPAERDFTAGDAIYHDPESGIEVPAAPHVRDAYRETLGAVTAEWREAFGRLGVGYEIVDTGMPFALPLRRAFAARERLY